MVLDISAERSGYEENGKVGLWLEEYEDELIISNDKLSSLKIEISRLRKQIEILKSKLKCHKYFECVLMALISFIGFLPLRN